MKKKTILPLDCKLKFKKKPWTQFTLSWKCINIKWYEPDNKKAKCVKNINRTEIKIMFIIEVDIWYMFIKSQFIEKKTKIELKRTIRLQGIWDLSNNSHLPLKLASML